MGKTVEIAAEDGGMFKAYCALPPGGVGPGLVLLQEAFGVTRFLRETADRFAENGFVVLAPDLYWRIEPGVELTDADFEKAMALYQRFDPELAIQDVRATIATLRTMDEHRGGVGAIGYCLGGRLAAVAAARGDVDCAIAYYGVAVVDHLAELEGVTVPLAFHYGAEDKHCAAEVAPVGDLVSRHANMSLWLYQGTDHAFANRHRRFYDHDAAELAHERTMAILRKALGPRRTDSRLFS